MVYKTMSKSFNHSFQYDQDLKSTDVCNLNALEDIDFDIDNYSNESRYQQQEFTTNTASNNIKLTSSVSTPSYHQPNINTIDSVERMQFLRDMEHAREELAEFRRNMSGLLKQMDNISTDLNKSNDRVSEIEQHLTATEEVNVNLQVLLEKAVKTQKESDVFATQTIRNMYSDLASIVYENSQLHGRIVSIESQQKEQKGNVSEIIKRMYEYTEMLEQAQGTIHMLQEPRFIKMSSSTPTSRRTSVSSGEDSPMIKPVIKPQQGLKMLLNNSSGSHLGLSSIAPKPI